MNASARWPARWTPRAGDTEARTSEATATEKGRRLNAAALFPYSSLAAGVSSASAFAPPSGDLRRVRGARGGLGFSLRSLRGARGARLRAGLAEASGVSTGPAASSSEVVTASGRPSG